MKLDTKQKHLPKTYQVPCCWAYSNNKPINLFNCITFILHLGLITNFLIINSTINCEEDDYDFIPSEQVNDLRATRTEVTHYSNLLPLQNSDNFFKLEQNEQESGDIFSSPSLWLGESTPPLDNEANFKDSGDKLQIQKRQVRGKRKRESQLISASRVYTSVERLTYGPDGHLSSPIFNLQSIDANPILFNNIIQQPALANTQLSPISGGGGGGGSNSDGSNAFDIIEGSGGGGNFEQPPDSSILMEDSTLTGDLEPTNLLINPTQVLTPRFNVETTRTWHQATSDPSDRPPVLNRRLPKLTATAGQVWKFFVPKETFVDEDGDLAQLKTMVVLKMPVRGESGVNKIDSMSTEQLGSRDYIGQFNSWLQYDATTQLLYGFPTDDQIGRHEYYLLVSDRWGQTSNETIEIHVRQHQSSRAFTHLILMNQVRWNSQKYPTLVDALGEFVRKITTQVFNDLTPYKNFVARYYTLEPVNQNSLQTSMDEPGENFNSSFTVAWSNASVPINPCNLSYIDNMSKFLIDIPNDSKQNNNTNSDNSNSNVGAIQYEPASNLIRALDYEFKPTSVSIFLQGACEGKEQHHHENSTSNQVQPVQEIDNNIENLLRVRIKIGKLTWKLGEAFEYQIPNETFEMGKNLVTRDLQLTLHTIDGLTFDSDMEHNFLEFDQETQTLFGSPYSLEHHVGQRELQLTGRNLKDGQKIHEVFVLNIDPKDLTTINNRAFRMSLYVSTRTGVFGPKERVNLMYKMGQALDGSGEYTAMANGGQQDAEFIVIDIQKFALAPKNTQQSRVTRVADNSSYSFPSDNLINIKTFDSSFAEHSSYGSQNYMYKYTWTDEKIGFRGDCPVEVIKENIIIALERVMMEYNFPEAALKSIDDDPNKNASEKFFERLKLFFEPDLNLIHLRFEPLNACLDALELHDVGDMELADLADKASEFPDDFEPQLLTTIASIISPDHPMKPANEINNDEYWSIIVLIILVLALLFVMLMFLLAMRTYRINQDKRFELQVRLAQARQNSMYLSSMMLADQATANDIQRMVRPSPSKSMYVIQDEEKGSRKPVILDSERQVLVGGSGLNHLAMTSGIDMMQKPTTVQMNGGMIHTSPLRPNMTFTLDSIASCIPQAGGPIMMQNPYMDIGQRSMTLNRRTSQNSGQQIMLTQQPLPNGHLNHSQSILTVASLGGPTQQITNLPVIYGPMLPVVSEIPGAPIMQMQQQLGNTNSLSRGMNQRRFQQQQHQRNLITNGLPYSGTANNMMLNDNNGGNFAMTSHMMNSNFNSIKESSMDTKLMTNGTTPATNGSQNYNKNTRSPSFSSSNPATPQSVISNPNYYPQN